MKLMDIESLIERIQDFNEFIDSLIEDETNN